jgi:hypothetical protein
MSPDACDVIDRFANHVIPDQPVNLARDDPDEARHLARFALVTTTFGLPLAARRRQQPHPCHSNALRAPGQGRPINCARSQNGQKSRIF